MLLTDNIGDAPHADAAKTGSTWVQTGASRRLVFGFTGWSEPTAPTGCGRYLIMPRDLSLSADDKLVVSHIPETKVLRVPGSLRTATVEAQVEVEQEQGPNNRKGHER